MERLQAADRKENPTWWIGDSGLSGVLLFRHWRWIQILNTDGWRVNTTREESPRQLEAGVQAGGSWTVVGAKFVGLKMES